MLSRRRISITGAALLSSVALAACGGSSAVTPAAYVKSVCQTVGPFERQVQSRSNSLDLATIKNPVQGKQALATFLGAVVSDTDNAISGLRKAGTPNVDNGKKISDAITNAFVQLRTAMASAQNQAKGLDTSSPQAFKNGATSLGSNIRTSMSSVGSSLSGLKSPKLESAAQKEPACQSLNSSGG